MARPRVADRGLPAPNARLLTPAEAAGYCRLSKPMFDSSCRVRPIIFGEGRVVRYDKLDLDAWIDGLKGQVEMTEDDVLAMFE